MKIKKLLITSIALLSLAGFSGLAANAEATHDYDHMGVQRTPSEEQSVEEGTLKQDEMAEKWGDMSSSEVNAERNYIKQNINNIHHGATSSINANDEGSSNHSGTSSNPSNNTGNSSNTNAKKDNNQNKTPEKKNKSKNSSNKHSNKKVHNKSDKSDTKLSASQNNHKKVHHHYGLIAIIVIVILAIIGFIIKMAKTKGRHSF